MILIADGGSTKVDWILLNEDKEELFRINSLGLNPSVLKESQLQKIIDSIHKLSRVKQSIKKIYFYGAGCGTQKAVGILSKVLQLSFTNAEINVAEDMLAAVYACTSEKPGIVCILGTGSNSCYYDGYKSNKLAESLGYTIMDEASGNYFGKRLLRDFYYKKMPRNIAKSFEKEFNLNVDFVKTNLYLEANPNMYLASFAKFMFDYKNEKYINKLIKKGFQKYFKYQVLPYNKGIETSIYFVGSIAYYFKDVLKKVALKNNLVITDVIQRPIDNLVRFHQKKNY